ncbi:MAG: hypothetical protein ACI8RD_006025 [Bacillariaceae sp.]|jgi:hypothetical protein
MLKLYNNVSINLLIYYVFSTRRSTVVVVFVGLLINHSPRRNMVLCTQCNALLLLS